MTEATVSAGSVQTLIEFATCRGANHEMLLSDSGLLGEDLNDQDRRISLQRYVALMSVAAKRCNNPAFALDFGACTQIKKMSVVGLMCYSASTMGEALQLLNRFGHLVMELHLPQSGQRFELQRQSGKLWLVDTRIDANSFPGLTEETWARFIQGNKEAYGGKHRVGEIHVSHQAPAHSAAYEAMFQVPVVFSSEQNALQIDDDWPDIKLSQPNPYMLGILSDHARQLLKSLENAKSTRGQVEALLIPELHKGLVSMSWVAGQLNLSRQTLYRKLKTEDISFEKLLDALKHQMALHYLSSGNVSINETAYLVGFSDPSAFSRAFKRWTGLRPGEALVRKGE